MEQRLRLVQGNGLRDDNRASERRRVSVPAQIIWKDAKGATRMLPVTTRDVSEQGVSVECMTPTAIPLFRLVYFQVDRSARNVNDLPAPLRKSNVLSAIFRVGESSPVTGAPTEYALRLLIEPEARPKAAVADWSAGANCTRTA